MENKQYYYSDDVRLTDVVRTVKTYSIHIFKKFWLVIIFTAIVTLAGYLFAVLSPVNYEAHSAFSVVDAKSGMSAGIMSMASSFGLNLGAGTNDVLYGVYTSRNVIYSAFLEEVDYKGEKRRLADIYMDMNDMTEDIMEEPYYKDFKWKAKSLSEVDKRERDLLAILHYGFTEGYFEIEYDVLSGLIRSIISTSDYDYSMLMAEAMLKHASKYFIRKQIESNERSLAMISEKLESVKAELKEKEHLLASVKDNTMYMKKNVGKVDQGTLLREINTLNVIFSNTNVAHDAAKASLASNTPVINVVDNPRYAMKVDKRKPTFWMIIGAIAGFVIGLIYVIMGKAIKDAFEEEERLGVAQS